MDVCARVDVVEQIPADVVGIFINYKIVSAVPAPIRANSPVPRSDLEAEPAREPETVMIAIEALDAISKGRAEMFEAPVLEGMINVVALVVGGIVAVPFVAADVRMIVDPATWLAFGFRLGMRVIALRRRRRNVALIGAWRIWPTLGVLTALLSK